MCADRRGALLAMALLASGCGPLADGSYLGEPLFTLSGNVVTGDGLDYADENLRVSVFWAAEDETVEETATVLTTSFPARYELAIYAYPPDRALIEAPWSEGTHAVGMPLLYLDEDGDGRWSRDHEPLVGGAEEEVVLYAEAEDGELDQEVQQGFQRMYADGARFACDGSEAGVEDLWPSDATQTNLVVGEWWLGLADWDCDEDLGEWDDLCPEGDELEDWCFEIEDQLVERALPEEEEDLYEECSSLCEEVLAR